MSLINTNRVKVLVEAGNLSGLYKELEEFRICSYKSPRRLVVTPDTILTQKGNLKKGMSEYHSLVRLFKELGCFCLWFEVDTGASRYLQAHFEGTGKYKDAIFKEDCVTYFGICNDIDLTRTLKDAII